MSRDFGPFGLDTHFAKLQADGAAEVIAVNETFWQDLGSGKFGSFDKEYLLSTLQFDRDWPVWEMHPQGDEIAVLLSGAMDFVLEKKSGNRLISLKETGAWALIPKGLWHTARVHAASTILFITPGEGTLQRPVDF